MTSTFHTATRGNRSILLPVDEAGLVQGRSLSHREDYELARLRDQIPLKSEWEAIRGLLLSLNWNIK